MSTLLKIEFIIAEELADEAGVFIVSKVPHGWEETPIEGGRKITLYLEDHPLGMEVVKEFQARFPDGDVTYGEEEPEDWAMAWKDFFVPVNCGESFKIFPPWLSDDDDTTTKHITIEPKMAFGTGHHPTTSLCLATIGDLAKSEVILPGQTFLDLGTGSGILGIGLSMLGLTGVALDIDPLAVSCAVENAGINDVAECMELAVGSIDCLADDVEFDLVVANILSGPLIEMASDILARIKPGGSLVLSGILVDKQSDAVADAYEKRGIGQPQRFTEGEWVCLTWDNIGS
ncbi:50S ribosomal protein L11 methyltransferase [Pseudodesulfovibrio sediminis]|uniref:Ribosomal protein L11 methyltransferase n=1 Tax=Pseudodesulfovibrio sediminis TaxID=2810563 RepID=A0ABN6EMF7_9BACT|nr:50S ribosomal protein L11 methyltransferase [Pseudodesulfovibrio sediminis]BCS87207.1 50S ribosomal protein L11 methyltransferase [Pseudodesulfovibrio sediminis]